MKNKKAELDNLVKIVPWIVFFLIILTGVYFLVKRITG